MLRIALASETRRGSFAGSLVSRRRPAPSFRISCRAEIRAALNGRTALGACTSRTNARDCELQIARRTCGTARAVEDRRRFCVCDGLFAWLTWSLNEPVLRSLNDPKR